MDHQPPNDFGSPATSLQSQPVSLVLPIIVLSVLIGCGSYYWLCIHERKPSKDEKPCAAVVQEASETEKHQEPIKHQKSGSKGKKGVQQTSKASPVIKAAEHPLCVATLNGLTREATSVSINSSGTRIVVASSDSSIRVFTIDPNNLQGKQTYVKGVINSDYCTAVDLSVDDQFVFGATELSCKLVKLAVNAPGVKMIQESPSAVHKGSVRWLSSSKGRWIITASENDDTDVKIFNYSLELLSTVDTKQVKNFHLAVSPIDGRFFGVAAWSPGVRVMEIVSPKEGKEFKKVEKAMDLPSACGLTSVAFNSDNTKAITACKSGVLILWNTGVRYQASEDPKMLLTVKEDFTDNFHGYSQLHFSSDSSMIIGISNTSIRILKTIDLSVVKVIESAHLQQIRSIAVNPTGQYFVTAAPADTKPRLWRLPDLR